MFEDCSSELVGLSSSYYNLKTTLILNKICQNLVNIVRNELLGLIIRVGPDALDAHQNVLDIGVFGQGNVLVQTQLLQNILIQFLGDALELFLLLD